MRIDNRCSCRTLTLAVSALVLATCAAGAVAAPVTGTKEIKLTQVFATLPGGGQDQKPEDVAACRAQVSAPGSRYLDTVVTTRYSIDAQSLKMTASSSLPSPKATQPLSITVPLAPLGIAGQYAFGAFRPAALPNTYVLFSIGLDFKAANSSVLVLNSDKGYNCLVTSNPTPFKGALSAKFGSEQGK